MIHKKFITITLLLLAFIFACVGANAESSIKTPKESLNATTSIVEPVRLPVAEDITPSVPLQIRMIAREHNFKWEDYLLRLAECENDNFDPKRINDKGNYPADSVDRGIFMINDYWHSEVSDECAFDVRCATEWTMERIEAGYQEEWVCNNIILNK